MHAKEHSEKVCNTKTATEVSWFQPHAKPSLKLIRNSGVTKTAAIIDVGGGASTLVDDLLNEGCCFSGQAASACCLKISY